MGEFNHFLHEHKLILNEAEGVGKDEKCRICRQPINKLLDAVYRCNTSLLDGSPSSECIGFFLHKTCSELPSTFTHPMYPQHPLSLVGFRYQKQTFYLCRPCKGASQGYLYRPENFKFLVCLKCVKSELKSLEDRSLPDHPGHNHPLTLVQSPALFLCHACNTTATDLSYICNTCCFWIHKSCANAPITYQSKFTNLQNASSVSVVGINHPSWNHSTNSAYKRSLSSSSLYDMNSNNLNIKSYRSQCGTPLED